MALGPGVLSENSTEVETVIIVQAKDTKQINRTSGSDIFEAKISYQLTEESEEVLLENRIEDLNNGQYKVYYHCAEEVSNVKIDINFKDENGIWVPIRGCPYRACFSHLNDKRNNDLKGTYLQNKVIKELNDIEKDIVDSKNAINIKSKDRDLSDVEVLLSVKSNLQRINQTREEVFLKIEIIEQTLQTLATENNDPNRNSSDLKKAIKLKDDWNNL